MRTGWCLALVPLACCVVLSACDRTAAPPSAAAHHAPATAADATPRAASFLTGKVRSCRLSDLTVSLDRSGLGLTTDFAAFGFRDHAAKPCAMTRRVTFQALAADGAPLSTSKTLVSAPASPPLILLSGHYRGGRSRLVRDVGVLVQGGNGVGFPIDTCRAARIETAFSWRVSLGGSSVVASIHEQRTLVRRLNACLAPGQRFDVSRQSAGRTIP
jgi:hypothetical protein